LISNTPKFKKISCGANHTLAITQEDTVYSWGFGTSLACGNGDEEDVETPMLIQGQRLDGLQVLEIGAGGQHSVLLAKKKS